MSEFDPAHALSVSSTARKVTGSHTVNPMLVLMDKPKGPKGNI